MKRSAFLLLVLVLITASSSECVQAQDRGREPPPFIKKRMDASSGFGRQESSLQSPFPEPFNPGSFPAPPPNPGFAGNQAQNGPFTQNGLPPGMPGTQGQLPFGMQRKLPGAMQGQGSFPAGMQGRLPFAKQGQQGIVEMQKDGTKTVRFADGKESLINPDGTGYLRDGTKMSRDEVKGSFNVTRADGLGIETRQDGTSIFKRSNGLETVRTPEGKIYMRDSKTGQPVGRELK